MQQQQQQQQQQRHQHHNEPTIGPFQKIKERMRITQQMTRVQEQGASQRVVVISVKQKQKERDRERERERERGNIDIDIYGTPPMYPRLSSKSQLWEGVGTWDALVPTPSSRQNGVVLGLGESACKSYLSSMLLSTTLRPGPNYRVFKRIQGVFN